MIIKYLIVIKKVLVMKKFMMLSVKVYLVTFGTNVIEENGGAVNIDGKNNRVVA